MADPTLGAYNISDLRAAGSAKPGLKLLDSGRRSQKDRSLLGYFLLTLLPLAAVVYVVWAYRKRRAERIAASSKRFSDIFGAAPKAVHSPPASVAAVSSAPASCVKKDKLLEPHHALLFQTLVACIESSRARHICPCQSGGHR
jgi:hypothetical protein